MTDGALPGTFIALEGLDGCGKGTQTRNLASWLKERGKKVLATHEPTKKSPAADEIRAVLTGERDRAPAELQGLFAQDREWHLENEITPALEEGSWVVCDRYLLSSLAYGVAEGVAEEELVEQNKEAIVPDLTLVLRASPEKCLERIRERGEGEALFERQEKLEKISEAYEQVMPRLSDSIEVIDAEQSPEEVFEDIRDVIGEHFRV